MAYNLQSLITILQQILDPEQTRWIVNQNKPQLESILEKAESLQQLLEKCPLPKVAGSLEWRIRDAAYRAEDVIESRMVRQMLSAPQGVDRSLVLFTFFTPYLEQVKQQLDLQQDLERVTHELDLAMQQVVKLMEGTTMVLGGSGPTPDHVHQPVKLVEVEEKKMAAVCFTRSEEGFVGVDADLFQLKDRLTNMARKDEIIVITGKSGTGKSTFVRKLYDDPDIISHFDHRGWAFISDEPNMREILLSLIGIPNGNLSDKLTKCSEYDLKCTLYRRLRRLRYMIVLDDVCSAEFLDDICNRLRYNKNGSRIVITTRDPASNIMRLNVKTFAPSESWDLLRHIVFGEDDCPLELQAIGTKIVDDCQGYPLAIQVIGGFLSTAERSREVWENFSIELKASIVESDNNSGFFGTISFSYNHLPIYLKPCFLYIGALPKANEIKGTKLISLWIAQGFVKSNGDKSLEEEAEDYLKVLVDRNLLSVARRKLNGKPKSYSIHDSLLDICREKGYEEKFRCVSLQPEMEDENASPHLIMPLARSFICTWKKIKSPIFSILSLLRVLDVMRMDFQEFHQEILQLVNLRYLAFSCTSSLPIGISRLWNLQTFIVALYVSYLPSELWELSELRHLKLINTKVKIKETIFVHEKLQTLSCVWVIPSLIRSGFFEKIPNIRKLGIYYEDSPEIEVDLRHLHKLEKLKCESALDKDGSRFLHKLRFPCNLRKLTLDSCVVFGSLFTTLCALPNLEVLIIEDCVFESEAEKEWVATEGDEFRSLQVLCINRLNLVRWKVDETNFPRLRILVVKHCDELEEIPSAIGYIPTLQKIGIYSCGAESSAVNSAQQIQMEQGDCGNNGLIVDIAE